MKSIFNQVKLFKPPTSNFDLSHDVKLSCNMGYLVPTAILECVPGDSYKLSCESLLRFAPLVSPVMHRMDVYMHYFFVPNRILWPGWEDYAVNGGLAGTPPAFPTVTLDPGLTPNIFSEGTLTDYLGIPPIDPVTATNYPVVSALPYAAYQMIYNEYYRDQNLVNPINFELVNGDNSANTDLFTLRKRAWQHDYFTASLPFAQKGPAVGFPISGQAPVVYSGATAGAHQDWNSVLTPGGASSIRADADPASPITAGHLAADLDQLAQGTTINEVRRAFKLQEWFERMALGGTRYIENIRAMFGVNSSDKRLQRPEYITGTKSPVVISEVLNTTGTTSAPQGNMAGHGVSVTSGQYGHYFCEEHGYIIGIMSVMPTTCYQQGVPKHFLKVNDPTELYWPQFANIGEQEVKGAEIFFDFSGGGGTYNDSTFGYVPRYAEYKFQPSRVAGAFRSSLSFWHLGRIFQTNPALNQSFVECDPRNDIFAVTTGQHLYAHVLHKITARRPMPYFGTPHI